MVEGVWDCPVTIEKLAYNNGVRGPWRLLSRRGEFMNRIGGGGNNLGSEKTAMKTSRTKEKAKVHRREGKKYGPPYLKEEGR